MRYGRSGKIASYAPDTQVIADTAARLIPGMLRPQVERVQEGVSTSVYRVRQAETTCYLRVLPERDASFAPEVFAHQQLRERGVMVPEILAFEHYNETLERSVMVTSEISGASLAHCADSQAQRRILRAAGRDLAVINRLAVQGFGWVQRDRSQVTYLQAEHPSCRAFLCEYLERDLTTLAQAQALQPTQLADIRGILSDYDAWLDSEQAWLAHGDFDVTHIYQEDGQYSGIIDFGEIRGAGRLYDLGHFRMHDGETLPGLVLPWLLEGYQEITPLPDSYRQGIAFASLHIAIRTLARAWQKRPQALPLHHGLRALARDIHFLRARSETLQSW